MVAPNITGLVNLEFIKKIVSSLFFDVLKGCFEYKKVFLGRIMCPRYMSQAIKIRW